MSTMMSKYFKKKEITLDEIFNIINNSIKSLTNIMFVCNFKLAKEISKYLDYLGIEDKNTALYQAELDEYYAGLSFYEDEIFFDCECARGKNGEFKTTSCEDITDEDITDYYIFLEMTSQEIDKKLQGEGSWNLCDLVDEDDDDDDDCDDNCEDDDSEDDDCDDDENTEAIFNLLVDFADKIIENNLCPSCTFNTLIDVYFSGVQAGYRDAKLEIIEQLSEEVDD